MQRKPLPPPTLATLYPPVRGYTYFDQAAALPFVASAHAESAVNRWWLAEHSLLAYESPTNIEAILAAHDYHFSYFNNASKSAFAYTATKSDHGVLVFRGTEALTPGDSLVKLGAVLRDWLTNAQFARVPFLDAARVHAGFLAALDSLWMDLQPKLSEVPFWWCTGHSMGAALAALAAVRMQQQENQVAALVTFGQPRTGDTGFARCLEGFPVVRVVNACDIVPRLPPEALGFEHAGTLVHLDAEKLERYGTTLLEHLIALPGTLKNGLGALTPIELIDHAPLYYAIKCFNAAIS